MAIVTVSELGVGHWQLPAVVFAPDDVRRSFEVLGVVGNSVPSSQRGKDRLVLWKRSVAAATRNAIGGLSLDPSDTYAISLGFSFHPPNHGNVALDVENFLKPTLDALAAGLFCPEHQSLESIARYGFDDTGFRYLFVFRLPDAEVPDQEGAGITVSVIRALNAL